MFFSHLATKLVADNLLTLGSDDEKAIRISITRFFPNAKTVLCSKHLRDNIKRKLDAILGNHTVESKSLMAAICNLMETTDTISFDATLQTMRQNQLSQAPAAFNTYFESKVPLLRANAEIQLNAWTNNNSEAINHVLKQYIQWRPEKLPDLVSKLHQLVIAQQHESDRALIGRGDFVLQPHCASKQLTLAAWKAMSAKQRSAASAECINSKPLSHHVSVTSRDGLLSVTLTPGAGKKPQQNKRYRSERTRSTNMKRRPNMKRHLE
jgi:hypothetical protein